MHKQHSIYLQSSCAEEYDEDRFGGSFGQYLHDHEVETFLSMINGYHGGLLDVGAGTGKLSLPFMRAFGKVVSIDSSSKMLAIARQKAEREGAILKSAICDAEQLCFRNNSFQCVVSSRVLMHLTDWRAAIAEFCRVGRCVVVDFPPLVSCSSLDSLFKRCKKFFKRQTQIYKTFPIRSVVKEFHSHNFQTIVLRKHFVLPIVLHRWINRPGLSLGIENLARRIGLVRLFGAPVTVKAVKINHPGEIGQRNGL